MYRGSESAIETPDNSSVTEFRKLIRDSQSLLYAHGDAGENSRARIPGVSEGSLKCDFPSSIIVLQNKALQFSLREELTVSSSV